MTVDPAAFVRANTRLESPSLVPELKIHLAHAATDLWAATEATLERTGLPPPYWAFAWPGGQALARHLLDRPDVARGRRVLDFAAGSGVAALAAAKVGAAAVAASEIDAFARAALALNAEANGLALDIRAADVLAAPAEGWDLILAGDVFYEKPMADRVWPWLVAAAARGIDVCVADPGRAYLPASGLVEIARYTVPTTLDLEDRTTRETRVLRVSS
ncbi:MAG: methyltransferase [Azospirillum sp.]|nr:methyltransferase [Azospirillum sp.]MCA3268116.1 methyltransferase [Azospirillum sp.]MCZ8124136.1 50S ribosomal protein L11 methyltransferase [Magnetospirillum sp.]